MKQIISFVVICSALLSSCSNGVSINGNVFIEKNGTANKLALTEIQIIPENAFKDHIKTQTNNEKVEEEKLLASVAQWKNILNMQLNNLKVATGGAYLGMHLASTSANELEETQRKINETQSALTGIKTGANGEFYYPKSINGESQKLTSDADGKFNINISKSGRYVLVAKKDNYYWMIWIDSNKTKGTISLNNSNLNGTNCDDCVFTKTITPANL